MSKSKDTPEIEVGGVVALKAGGPDMTVECIERNGSDSPTPGAVWVTCLWFGDLDCLQRSRIRKSALVGISHE